MYILSYQCGNNSKNLTRKVVCDGEDRLIKWSLGDSRTINIQLVDVFLKHFEF